MLTLYFICNVFFVNNLKLVVLCQFCEFDILKSNNNKIYEISTAQIDFDCILYLCTVIYIICYEETILVTKKKIVAILSNEDNHRVFKI